LFAQGSTAFFQAGMDLLHQLCQVAAEGAGDTGAQEGIYQDVGNV
jgi:hypothetical protein